MLFSDLQSFDNSLFYFINHLPHNLFLDSFFAFLSGVGNWGIIWFVILAILFAIEEVKDKKIIFILLCAGILTLFVADLGLKHMIKRLRPEFVLPATYVVSDHARSFSFPSGHTTIAFAAAYIMAREHRKWAKFYYILAILIAFSRMYLGKHFPSDIIGGIFIGSLIGYFSLFLANKSFNLHKRKIKIK